MLRCPLTENLGAVIDALRRLHPGAVRPGGTDLGAGLDAALEAIDPQEHAQGQAIVVFSDGEDLAERWRPRLERLEDRTVPAISILNGGGATGLNFYSSTDSLGNYVPPRPFRFT